MEAETVVNEEETAVNPFTLEVMLYKLKNQILYLLQIYKTEVKFTDFYNDFYDYYEEELDCNYFKCQNLYSLLMKFDDILEIKRSKYVELKESLKGNPKARLVFTNEIKIKPNIPPSVKQGDCYEIMMGDIYDPSKFWIVIKPKELKMFEDYLNKFFKWVKNYILIPRQKITMGMVCMVYYNDVCYRAQVISTMYQCDLKIRVFLLDYGKIINVVIDNIYYLQEHLTSIPRFAMRACLAYLSPINGNTWSLEDTRNFTQKVEKRDLLVKICEIEEDRHILHVAIRELCQHQTEYVNNILMNKGIAKRMVFEEKPVEKCIFSKYKNKLPYMHFFPVVESIESGKVPKSLEELELLKRDVPLDKIYNTYFEYVNLES